MDDIQVILNEHQLLQATDVPKRDLHNQYVIYAMADLAIAIIVVSMVPLEDYHFEFDKQNTNVPLVLSCHLTLATR